MLARLALNYKGIAYKTEWMEFPDIKPTLISYGIAPNDPASGNFEYSVPTVRLPDGTYVMESRAIATALEKLQPEPSLDLDEDCINRTQGVVGKIMGPFLPELMPKVATNLLPQRSRVFFEETREVSFGMPLSELAKSDKAGEAAWQGAQAGVEELKALLAENTSGPYIKGAQVSYADFIVVAVYQFLKRLDEADFDRFMSLDKSFVEHYDGCKKWLERDTY